MLRKIVILMALFIIGMIAMIASEDCVALAKVANDFETEINGDLKIESSANTNDEALQKPEESVILNSDKVRGLIHYTLGARVKSDRLVASGGQNQSYPSPHNVQIQLTYPSQGYGAMVTYVAIVVNQTSNLGQAYIVKGGIHEHLISVVVEAYNTNVFNVFAYVYGV